MTGTRAAAIALLLAGTAVACEDFPFDEETGPPRNLSARYYAQAVTLEWDLPSNWGGESFLVYSGSPGDPDWFVIAEVSSCIEGWCTYLDVNIDPNTRYEYYVATFDPGTGFEEAGEVVEVDIPDFGAPPSPKWIEAIPLDGANYLIWDLYSTTAEDWAFYRVYLETDMGYVIIGETDSEGFLDERAENGVTSRYAVTAVDHWGHEGQPSDWAAATPRPDFTGEVIYDYHTRRELSGFRFLETDGQDPLVDGDSRERHFRLEVTERAGWLLVPGPSAAVFPEGFQTTALRCGPGADRWCSEVRKAPESGYVQDALPLEPQVSYVFRIQGDDGRTRYGVIRTAALVYTAAAEPLAIFDWAYQTQAENVALFVPGTGGE